MADLGQIIANAIQSSLAQFQSSFVPNNSRSATLVPLPNIQANESSTTHSVVAVPQPGAVAPPNSPDTSVQREPESALPPAPLPAPQPITPYQSIRLPPPSASSLNHPSLISLMSTPSAASFRGMASLGVPLPSAGPGGIQVSRLQVNANRRDSAARHSSTSRKKWGRAVPPPGLEHHRAPQVIDAF